MGDFTMGDLKAKLGGKEKPINFDTANDIITAILEVQLDSDTANVTLGLKTFLSRFFHASLASTKVYVHSPNKDYAPASGAAKDVNVTENTTDQFTKKVAAGFALADGAGKITDHTPGQALRMRLSQQIAEKSTKKKKGKKGADEKPKEVKKPKTAKDLTGKEELTMHEFMALLHGDELQTWVRESKARWSKLRTIRGLLAYFGEEHVNTKINMNTHVFCGGVTVHMMLMQWRDIAKDGIKKKKKT